MPEYNKDDYIFWFLNSISNEVNYHNHKESVAWTALAFYIPAIIALSYGAGKILHNHIESQFLFLLVGLIIMIPPCAWAFTFILRTFENRWDAHWHIAKLRRAIGQLNNCELILNDERVKIENNKRWPQFVEDIKRETLSGDEIEIDKWLTERTSLAAVIFFLSSHY